MKKPPVAPQISEPRATTVMVPISDLVHDPHNVKVHPERQLADLRAGLVRFGQHQALVARRGTNVVLIGNARLQAMRELGWTHAEVRYVDDDDLTAKARALSDNRISDLGDYDEELLARTLQELDAADALEGVGFSDDEFREALAAIGETGIAEEPEVPLPPDDPVTRRGDLWVLGEHRLLCGDSACAVDVERLMAGDRATCVFTDAPYGVDIAGKNRFLDEQRQATRSHVELADDALAPADLRERLLPVFELLRTTVMAEDCTLLATAPQGGDLGPMMMMMRDAGLPPRHVLIWRKNAPTFSMGRLDYDYQHEPILLTWGKRHQRPMRGQHRTSVWDVDKPRASPEHATTKPVELYVNAYLNHSESGDMVADVFCGSGTCLVAAEQVGRRCRAMEILPAFVDVAVQRWQQLTGREAVLDGDGRTFTKVAAERGVAGLAR